MNTALLIGTISEGLGLIGVANQLYYIQKNKTTRGLSGWSWTLTLASNIAWATFGFQKNIAPLFIANIVVSFFSAAIVARLYISSQQRTKMFTYAAVCGIVLSLMYTLFSAAAGWIALTFSMLSRTPQLYRVWHDKKLDGISYKTQVILMTQNLITVVYALLFRAWPLAISAFLGFLSFLYIIWQVAKKTRNK